MSDDELTLYYPSGNMLSFKGECKGLMEPGSALIIEVCEDTQVGDQQVLAGNVIAADARCVCVVKGTQRVVFNPREHLMEIDQTNLDWLNSHPEWPNILELIQPTRRYSPSPWSWSDAGGKEAFALRASDGKPVMLPVMQITPGPDVEDRAKAFDKAKEKTKAKLAAIAPVPEDASILAVASELLEALETLLKASQVEGDPAFLIQAQSTASAVLQKAKAPIPHLPPGLLRR